MASTCHRMVRSVVVARAASTGRQQEAVWESQVRDGRVKSVDTRSAGGMSFL